MRNKNLKALALSLIALALAPAIAAGQFKLRDVNSKSLEVTDNGAPVFTYNYGIMLKEGVNPDRARCCYLYPVYAPNGVEVTDDFPVDHPHHRGISWTWPIVKVDGKTYNLWAIEGIHDRFEKWKARKAGSDTAVLAVQNGWYVGERRVVEEDVKMVAHSVVNGRRDLDITVTLRPVGGAEVEIGGTHDHNKGYGGALEVRFAPRTGTRIRTSTQDNAPSSDRLPAAWAELTGNFSGKIATTRVTEDPSNPGAPNGWCLRHYGFVGVEYPALELRKLDSRKPLKMKFRVSLWGGSQSASLPQKRVLVYTRNGKGYVHDNIPLCVAAIKKMGAENGFGVDVTDDALYFRDAVLKQYQAVVFANTNNQAFPKPFEREAFKHYIESGGGFVGIHSASGSERDWPYFQAVLGGKFVRHPHQQMFLVRVKDRKFPATRKLPATFEWRDECYLLGHLNPDIHVLLTTDYNKIDDPDKAKHPEEHFSGTIPLAWYHRFDGGREYYLALGHNKEDYSNPLLYNQILGGILWAMGGK
ncbi:MAG TPA: ThuA domain-containing protein [Terriglobia bacterium]|nr:ThuA domain-containing protein [Terriglobia bacterium]